MKLTRIPDEEMVGVIWENGALLDSEQGREPTQLERFHWIAQAQLEADQAIVEQERRAIGEWLVGLSSGVRDWSAVFEFGEGKEALKQGKLPEGIKGKK